MSVLNQSYAILANADSRKAHDLWIAEHERVEPSEVSVPTTSDSPPVKTRNPIYRGSESDKPKPGERRKSHRPRANRAASLRFMILMHLREWWALYFLAGLIAFFNAGAWIENLRATSTSDVPQTASTVALATSSPAVAEAQSALPAVTRAAPAVQSVLSVPDPMQFAPNGKAWPKSAGYVDGYPRLRTSGRTTVTIDNSQNTATMFVKLFAIDGSRPQAVRVVYVPASGKFTISGVTPGLYDVRYEDPRTMQRSKSEPFTLRQEKTETGARYSNITMTLFTVANGNMNFTPISADEF